MSIKFGTGGWRAIIGDEFTRDNVRILCAALAGRMHDEGVAGEGIVIGYDRRFLSDVAARWAAQVLAAHDVPVQLITLEQAPTPLVMWTVQDHDTPYGMAVTASHNPALYNGIKVFTRGGRDADETVTADLERRIDAIEGPVPEVEYDDALASGMIKEINTFNGYIDAIVSHIDMEAIRKAELRIALDPMFGVSRTSLQAILITARAQVDVINERRDTLFGGRLPSPSSHTLQYLSRYVVDHGLDLGIATDGDADRIGIIDDKGDFVHPNELLVMLYHYLVKEKGWEGPVVRNIATTSLLDLVAERLGQECHEVPVGFKWVSAKMAETDAVLGGESSGGLTVRGHTNGKDGIYAAALLVEMLAVTGKKMSELWEEITGDFRPHKLVETDFTFNPEQRSSITKRLVEDRELPEFSEKVVDVSYRDGVKVYFEQGWILARFSGTEPLLRIVCEMDDVERAERIVGELREFLGLA